MGDMPGAPLPLASVTIDGLALPMQSYADDPDLSETFRKALPHLLDVSVLRDECAVTPVYEVAVFDNPVRITARPDAPLDPDKVAAARTATEAAMDAFERDRPLRALKPIWSATDLEAAAFNNGPNPRSSRARLRDAFRHLDETSLKIGQDGALRDGNGEAVVLELMVDLPHLNSRCHRSFLEAAIANLRAIGIQTTARGCMIERVEGEEVSSEAITAYLDCRRENTDIRFYRSEDETDLSLARSMSDVLEIDLLSVSELIKSIQFEPMSPADQAAGMALAFGERAIETGRLIPVSRVIAP